MSGLSSRPRVLGIGLVLLLVLGLLLTLQMRWLDELTQARIDETRRRLQTTCEQMASRAQSALGEVAARVKDVRASGSQEPIPLVREIVALEPGSEPPPSHAYAFLVEQRDGGRSWVVLAADELERELFPRLVASALDEEEHAVYRVTVRAAGMGEPALYQSLPVAAVHGAGPPDASTEFRLLPNRWIELDGDGAGWMSNDGPVFVAEGGSLSELRDSSSAWLLELQHVSGSLENAFASRRLRSALLGGGLLAMLLAGLAFLWLAEQRARRLAEREVAFIAGVSHELRTPLTVVRTAAANLARGIVREPADVAEYGTLIQRESERVGGLVERALRFARRDQPLDMERVETRDVIERAVERCAPWKDQRAFNVDIDVADGARALRANAESLTSAVHNLLENAVKYGPSGQTVRITARRAAGAQIVIEVSDEGPGIAPADQARIFEPFYRAAAVRTGGIPGTGLGLGVARDIAHAHGGELELTASTAAAGATFRISLPDAAAGEAT